MMADSTEQNEKGEPPRRAVILEWIAGGIGLLLTLALVGFIGWEAFTRTEPVPPQVEVRMEAIQPVGQGYVVEIVAQNATGETAQAVEIEGTLMQGGREVEKSTVTLDYVPGASSAHAGLYFTRDPAAGQLQLRALGYARP
jgi:uncharacterized protein (TIGR02588 family)